VRLLAEASIASTWPLSAMLAAMFEANMSIKVRSLSKLVRLGLWKTQITYTFYTIVCM
jgi:hypothetical protein